MIKTAGRILILSSIIMFSNEIFSFSFQKTKKVEAAEIEGAKAAKQIEIKYSQEDVKLLVPVRNDKSLVINITDTEQTKLPV